MANLTYRTTTTPAIPGSTTAKGAPLTNVEVDANFKALDNDVQTKASTAYVDEAAATQALVMAIALG